MADATYATVDLSDIDTAHPSPQQVKGCCRRMRRAMLSFRDGGRIIAGSYAPLAATLTLSTTLPDADLMPARSACVAVFEARARPPWPPAVAALPHWPPIYADALEELEHLELAATVDVAAETVQRIDACAGDAPKVDS
jgi:hypothetical protein